MNAFTRRIFPWLTAVAAALLLAGCESPQMREAKKKQAAINDAQIRYFTDPDVSRRIVQQGMAKFADVYAASLKAFDAAKTTTTQRLIKSVSPVYPISGRKTGVTGGVWIAFVVGTDGVPQSVEWLPDENALMGKEFVDAAITAVRQWRFEPAKADGKPIAVGTVVPVIFQFPY